jgi:hypothetical protein
MEKHPDLAP